jgi:asparagine synthase (glutamine-hydrolysing)
MFAFALWDKGRDRYFMARDRFGKKPLYICQSESGFFFASEIKAILAIPSMARELDMQSLTDYLVYRYVPAPNTFFRNIRKLAPGSYAVWKDGVLIETTYFVPYDAYVKPTPDVPPDCVEAFLAMLEQSVQIRMRSDVPFGAFLSGGLDSSAIVALMSRHSLLPINTFSVGFEGHNRSELPYARIIAQQFGTNHHEAVLDAEKFTDLMSVTVRALDAPVSEPATVPLYALSQLAAQKVKMVLSGEGADEFLGGYNKYLIEPMVSTYQKILPPIMWNLVIKRIFDAMPFHFRKAKTLAANLALCDVHQRFPRWFGALTLDDLSDLLSTTLPQRPLDDRPFNSDPNQSALRRIQYFDQISWLPDNLLERGDRVTMAASLEARMPFMDHVLSGFIAGLPDSVRIRGITGKWLLREAMKEILPPAVLNRPKIGFAMPLSIWFQGPMKAFLHDLLLDPNARTRSHIRLEATRKILEDHMVGNEDHEKLIWTLVNLELFQREYVL